MTQTTQWWQIRCQAENSEEFAAIAMIEGAKGTEIIDSEEFFVYADSQPTELIEQLKSYGILIKEFTQIKPVNYVQKCADVWQPITVGDVSLKPVLDSDGPTPNVESGTIWIIPGNGFGTGHHESTRLAIGLMLKDEVLSFAPKQILDLGTGNGVLGLSAALKFTCQIDAIDTDYLAIENAEQNCRLNPEIGSKLNLITGDISKARDDYDLIFANIYASTLIQLQGEMRSRLKRGGFAILAGIMLHEGQDVERSYSDGWKVVARSGEGNWTSFLLQRL